MRAIELTEQTSLMPCFLKILLDSIQIINLLEKTLVNLRDDRLPKYGCFFGKFPGKIVIYAQDLRILRS